jgi:hypothetical protein
VPVCNIKPTMVETQPIVLNRSQLETIFSLALDSVLEWENLVCITFHPNLNDCCYYRKTRHVFKNYPLVDV